MGLQLDNTIKVLPHRKGALGMGSFIFGVCSIKKGPPHTLYTTLAIKMQFQVQIAALTCLLTLATGAHDLSELYPFKATLNTAEDGGVYELYWIV